MNDMRFGVLQALDEIIINGNGTAPNPRGIANLTGTNTQAKGTDTILDAVRKAKTLCMTTGKAQPNAVLMHPNGFQEVETFTATGAAAYDTSAVQTFPGVYVMGNPATGGPRMLWGMQVVVSENLTPASAWVGDFARFSMLRDRQSATVEIGLNSCDFIELKKTLRAVLRAAVIFTRPAAFTEVTGL